MVCVRSSLLLALCALISATTIDITVAQIDSRDTIMDQVRSNDLPDNAVFVNDVNLPTQPVFTDNGFGAGLPVDRSATDNYVAPQLVAPQNEALPLPVPQNAAADVVTAAASSDVVGADAAQPIVAAAAAALPASNNEQPVVAAAVAAAPSEVREATEAPTQPATVAAAAEAQPQPPVAAAAEAQPQPQVAAAAEAQPQPPVAAAAEAQPQPPVAAAAEAQPQAGTPTSKLTEFASTDDSGDSVHGAHIATFAAVGAACALVVAGVVIARKRKMIGAKSPGTPKNDMTFFHVQSRLTPPPV